MEFLAADCNDLEYHEKNEKLYRSLLSRTIAEAELEKFQLRYIPDYIRDLRIDKVVWGKEYRKWHDPTSLKKWRACAKQLQDEIRKHKIILKNLDVMNVMFAPSSNDFCYFSQSLDPERVDALVSQIKENESNDNIICEMLEAPENDFTQTFYVIYASCARYGEFRVRPSSTYLMEN